MKLCHSRAWPSIVVHGRAAPCSAPPRISPRWRGGWGGHRPHRPALPHNDHALPSLPSLPGNGWQCGHPQGVPLRSLGAMLALFALFAMLCIAPNACSAPPRIPPPLAGGLGGASPASPRIAPQRPRIASQCPHCPAGGGWGGRAAPTLLHLAPHCPALRRGCVATSMPGGAISAWIGAGAV